jgi:uncharacterized protein
MKAIAAVLLIAAPVFAQRDYPVKPVPFTAVHVTDAFWAPKIETNRKVTIPFAFQKDEETGRVDLFVRAAKALRGEPLENRQPPGYPFDDTDVYKVLEGAAYALSVAPDPKLDAYVDGLIAKIGAAQENDGYLFTTRTIDPLNPHRWAGKARWELETDLSHELYNLGHLYEAAVAHYQATGKRSLLDIAIRTADLLVNTFGQGKRVIWPGHQITEMGLAKLYRATGEQKYLELAKFLLDVRGPGTLPAAGRTYNQSHKKVVEQDEAVGHAVRATYMYSGMADVAALTGDTAYVGAIDRIWENVAGKKLYVTGGIGATGSGEAFGPNYQLPNMTAYNETCAAIGNDYWNHRLFLLHADAKYIDVMERTLYNGLISGVSLDGKTFFYPNPLESNGQHARSPWFGVACCPGNITRFMASVPGYVYAQKGDAIWVNLYMASNADLKLDNGRTVKVTQETRYPWDGGVKMTVEPDREGPLTIHVRIPGWARNEPVASDLYQFADRANESVTLKVNGKAVATRTEKGYVELTRAWKRGDTIELAMPMPVRRLVAHNLVDADRSRVAIQRGPIVYAAEWPDNPNGKVRNLVLPATAKLTAEHRTAFLNGVTVVKGRAVALAYDAQGKVVRAEQDLTMIPYFAWANRGRGQMMVWLPSIEAVGRPLPYPTLTTGAKLTTSGRKNPDPIKDGEEPAASNDPTSYFDWWPQGTPSGGTPRVTSGWVEYEFPRSETLSESQLYWFDDTGRGGVRVPLKWRILWRDGAEWKPVEVEGGWGVDRNRYNVVKFKPVTSAGLRLEVEFQEGFSAGVQRWRVK